MTEHDAVDWSKVPVQTGHAAYEVPVELIHEIRARVERESDEAGDVQPD